MIHRLWYISLVLELIALILVWDRGVPMFSLWLAFDIITGLFSICLDLMHPADPAYQMAWELKQPGVVISRSLAAREVWNRLGARVWVAASAGISGLIYIGRFSAWSHSIIEAEFAAVAITSAALGMVLWLALRSARKLTAEPFVLNHGHLMVGYFLLSALCYYVAYGYRDTIGRATGIVACLSYGSWIAIALWHRRPA